MLSFLKAAHRQHLKLLPRPSLLSMLLLSLAAALGSACERQLSGIEPPLRPLIYTELPPNSEESPEEPAPISSHIAPEDLGYALFHALLERDRQSYLSMFISPQALSELIRMPLDKAEKESASLVKDSELLWELFAADSDFDAPLASLSTSLSLSEFRVGKGRNLAGKVAIPEQDEVVQHWGNELRIELVNSNKSFSIRLPKIVKTPAGWRLAQKIELDPSLRLYLESGMHLKSDLLHSEHYPYPLEVGNFWKYRISSGIENALPQQSLDDDSPNAPPEITKTEMIKEIIHRQGYWIVRFEQSLYNAALPIEEATSSRQYSYLVTPLRIYPCARDCRNNVDNLSYLLGYMAQQIPLYVFPFEVGKRWHTAGRRAQHNRYEISRLSEEKIVVPSGSFENAFVLTGSVEEGREERFFVPGTGVIKRRLRGGAGQVVEELILYRLIL